MSRIYLATSDRKNREEVAEAFRNKYKNDVKIINIHTTEELMSVLYEKYKILFVDSTILKDISNIKKDELQGQIFFMSPGLEEDTTSPKIKLFPNIVTLIPWIRLNDFVNKEIENVKNNSQPKNASVVKETETKPQVEEKADTEQESEPDELFVENRESSKEEPQNEDSPQVDSENTLLPKVDQELTEKIKKECEKLVVNEDEIEDIPEDDDEKDDLGRKTVANIINDTQKTVGIWSPVGQVGITQFSINFSIYLAKYGIPVAVVEGLTKSPKLKTWLNQYTKQPKEWISSLDYRINSDIPKSMSNNFDWVYKGVKWYPLDEPNDFTSNVDIDKYNKFLKLFIKSPILTFISLENYGSMSKYNLETLKYLDELWIITNNSYFDFLQYYKYTLDILKDYPELKLRIIFNQYEEGISYVEQIEDKLNCKITCYIPYNRDLLRHRKSKPFIENNEFYDFLKEPFDKAAIQLLGKNYKSLYAIDRERTSFLRKIIARFS